jgi:hypothetical protein
MMLSLPELGSMSMEGIEFGTLQQVSSISKAGKGTHGPAQAKASKSPSKDSKGSKEGSAPVCKKDGELCTDLQWDSKECCSGTCCADIIQTCGACGGGP